MTQADARERASVDVLAEVANDLAGEFRLQPLLGRILRSAVELLGCRSGSLCLIDQVSHTYRKAGTYTITATGYYCGEGGLQTVEKTTTVNIAFASRDSFGPFIQSPHSEP